MVILEIFNGLIVYSYLCFISLMKKKKIGFDILKYLLRCVYINVNFHKPTYL